jgi:hypothetical protein
VLSAGVVPVTTQLDNQDQINGAKLGSAAAMTVPVMAEDLVATRAVSLLTDAEGVSASGGSKTFQTYTKPNAETGEVYSGRTSGRDTPEQNVAKRDSGHHMNEKGFGPAKLDKSSSNSDAIRGREQQLIEKNGGAKSQGGTSGNAINGVSPKNLKATTYKKAAENEFGQP